MTTKHQQVVWITGASSGLGRTLALALAHEGWRVIATARNEVELKVLSSLDERIKALPCDITDEASLEVLQTRITKITPSLDRVILNAGSCEYLDFPNPDWSAVRRVMEVNYFGTVNCIKLALPLLRASQNRHPQLVVVASQATAAPFPKAGAYGGSKAALQYFCDCLRIDLAAEKIAVTVVNPGFIDTPLTRKNDFEMPFLMSADEAALRIVRKIASKPATYSFPLRLTLLLSLSKILPACWRKMVAPRPASDQDSSGGLDR